VHAIAEPRDQGAMPVPARKEELTWMIHVDWEQLMPNVSRIFERSRHNGGVRLLKM
jgi:hypothetical protein